MEIEGTPLVREGSDPPLTLGAGINLDGLVLSEKSALIKLPHSDGQPRLVYAVTHAAAVTLPPVIFFAMTNEEQKIRQARTVVTPTGVKITRSRQKQ
nr:hypothetical protein [uncultured Desulfobacter sp.]